jgi:hypothetical protein
LMRKIFTGYGLLLEKEKNWSNSCFTILTFLLK